MWHTSSANSSSPTAPPPLCPPSPPPSSLIEILPGTQTLPILGTKLRERERNTGTCTNRLVPPPLCLPSIHPITRTKGPGNPIGISLPLLPANICSNSEEFCWQLSLLCVFGDSLINLCVYVVCIGWGMNPRNLHPPTVSGGSYGLLLPQCDLILAWVWMCYRWWSCSVSLCVLIEQHVDVKSQ